MSIDPAQPKATETGTYTVTIGLLDRNNCVWEDGTNGDFEVKWTIKEASSSEPEPSSEHEPSPGSEPASQPQPASEQKGIETGKTVTTPDGCKYTATDTVTFTGAKNVKSVRVPDAVTLNGKIYKVTKMKGGAFKGTKIRIVTVGINITTVPKNAFCGSNITTVTLGKRVKKLAPKAFNNSKVKTVIVKTKKLKKARAVKGSFAGSKAKSVTVRWGKLGKKGKTYVSRSFTKKNTKAKKIVFKK